MTSRNGSDGGEAVHEGKLRAEPSPSPDVREALERAERILAYWNEKAPIVVADDRPIDAQDFGPPYNDSEVLTWGDLRTLLSALQQPTPGGDGEAVGWREGAERIVEASIHRYMNSAIHEPGDACREAIAAVASIAALAFPPKPSPAPSEGVREALEGASVQDLRAALHAKMREQMEASDDFGGDRSVAALSDHKGG
jgi:hypothetical protein